MHTYGNHPPDTVAHLKAHQDTALAGQDRHLAGQDRHLAGAGKLQVGEGIHLPAGGTSQAEGGNLLQQEGTPLVGMGIHRPEDSRTGEDSLDSSLSCLKLKKVWVVISKTVYKVNLHKHGLHIRNVKKKKIILKCTILTQSFPHVDLK